MRCLGLAPVDFQIQVGAVIGNDEDKVRCLGCVTRSDGGKKEYDGEGEANHGATSLRRIARGPSKRLNR